MKKIFAHLTTLVISAFFVSQAFADTGIGNACPGGNFSGLCFTVNQLGPVVGSFITFGFVIVGIIALVWLAWGGLKWLISQGEKTAVEEARNHIISAIIGLIVIFLSYLVVNVILGFVSGGKVSLGNLSVPTLGVP